MKTLNRYIIINTAEKEKKDHVWSYDNGTDRKAGASEYDHGAGYRRDCAGASGCKSSGTAADRIFDHFDKDCVQIIGYVEQAYLDKLTPERRHEVYDALISSQIPCLLFSRGMKPAEDVLELCNHYRVPCMVSERRLPI